MNKEHIAIIDLGNTLAKVGYYFSERSLELVEPLPWSDLISDQSVYERLSTYRGLFSSVLSKKQDMEFMQRFPQFVKMDHLFNFPINIFYETPESLGLDRIANAVGAWVKNPNRNSLIIDIGTCIKMDFISQEGIYLGGSIAPGIQLRYRSLHSYTAKLPLVIKKDKVDLTGTNTLESIQSGVINGVRAEIMQLMDWYAQKYEDLDFFITGGDAKYIELLHKNNIFASPHLTIEGLYEIFVFNEL